MADVKITGLTPKSADMAVTDLAEITVDPSGSPLTRSVTGTEIVGMVETATSGITLQAFNTNLTAINQALTTTSNVDFGTGTFAGIVSVDDTTDSTSISTGSGVFDGGIGVALTITAGTGIQLGGDAAANLLDDYEEGTWTPEYHPATGADWTSIVYSFNDGIYTKIGNVVICHIRLRTTSIDKTGTTAGASIEITGLPFTAGSGNTRATALGIKTGFLVTTPDSFLPLSSAAAANLRTFTNAFILVSDLDTGAVKNHIDCVFIYYT